MNAGFLAVDKPSGVTSHDVVDALRRVTGIRKAGHTGTLDPMATGVVVVALGGVTRLIRFLADQDKEYVATAVFGIATDTLDADGEEVDRRPMTVSEAELEAVRAQFIGEIQQVPPMVSALKTGGERLYDLARRGIEVEREARPVTIYELEFLEVKDGTYPEVTFRVVCGKGTYVRSLADDIAGALGGFAHLSALRRTRNGALTIDDAVGWDDLQSWQSRLVEPADALAFLPTIVADADTARLVGNGRPIPVSSTADGLVAVHDPAGTLLAVYRASSGLGRPEVVVAR
ncbi:MAG: tRNA pseudouridine(55) synthase TruB [Acidimicrobiia bacterium]